MRTDPYTPTGNAILLTMIGFPIAHARSPELFNRWFAGHGIDALMAPVDLEPARLADFYASLRGWVNCRGCVVTAPHKQATVDFMDTISDRASALGAVNVVTRSADGRLQGDNVDGEGFVQALRGNAFGFDGKRVMLFGSGGAGSAIALALAEAGVARICLYDLDLPRAERLAELIAVRTGLTLNVGTPENLSGFDLVINATTIGLDGKSMVFSPDTLAPDTLLADIIAKPVITPWLEAARGRGCAIQTGAEMAAGQFQLLAGKFGLTIDENMHDAVS